MRERLSLEAFHCGDRQTGLFARPLFLGLNARLVQMNAIINPAHPACRDEVVTTVGASIPCELDRIPFDMVYPSQLLAAGADDVHMLADRAERNG